MTLKRSCEQAVPVSGGSGPILGRDISMGHFIVMCLVAWPLNESEAEVDLVLIETSLLFLCKFLLIIRRTASLT